MRVYVSSAVAAINPQLLTYAEYRIFSSLARYPDVREAQVVLHTDEPGGAIQCSVTIEDAAGSARTSAKGVRAAAAIDGAAERVGQLMRQRASADRSSDPAAEADRPADEL